jgi:hypothetical protein
MDTAIIKADLHEYATFELGPACVQWWKAIFQDDEIGHGQRGY